MECKCGKKAEKLIRISREILNIDSNNIIHSFHELRPIKEEYYCLDCYLEYSDVKLEDSLLIGTIECECPYAGTCRKEEVYPYCRKYVEQCKEYLKSSCKYENIKKIG